LKINSPSKTECAAIVRPGKLGRSMLRPYKNQSVADGSRSNNFTLLFILRLEMALGEVLSGGTVRKGGKDAR